MGFPGGCGNCGNNISTTSSDDHHDVHQAGGEQQQTVVAIRTPANDTTTVTTAEPAMTKTNDKMIVVANQRTTTTSTSTTTAMITETTVMDAACSLAAAQSTTTTIATTTTNTNDVSLRYRHHPRNYIPNRSCSQASPSFNNGDDKNKGIFHCANTKSSATSTAMESKAATTTTTTTSTNQNDEGSHHNYSNCTSNHISSGSIGQRCYRLNLERPFDIHCEQSPLEYGDYMAPWTKEVRPITVGPTEYCPPRHLGGNGKIWQELMRWESSSSSSSTGASSTKDVHDVNTIGVIVGANKNHSTSSLRNDTGESSLDVVNMTVHEDIITDARNGMGVTSTDDNDSSRVQKQVVNLSLDEEGEEDDASSHNIVLTMTSSSKTSGYRCLTSPEQLFIQKRLGERDNFGGYTFEAYDLTHVMQPPSCDDSPTSTSQVDNRIVLRTVLSMESSSSEDECFHSRTAEEIAQDTARLFRRSELSTKERLEGIAVERPQLQRQRRRRRQQQQQPHHDEEKLPSDIAVDSKKSGDSKIDGKMKKKLSRSRTLSSSGKKLLRTMSRALSDMQGTPVSSSVMQSNGVRSSSVSFRGVTADTMDMRSSMQALTIDKARDLVDTCTDGGGNEDCNTKAKQMNVSLYIVGEYDILNDLVNDGAKRLRENKDFSDLHLLLQNNPCPPPDRWIRPTGWGKCNPSSMYAKLPPEDFDWVRYYDKLRLKTGPGSRRVVSRVGATNDDAPTQCQRQDGTTDTQTTAMVVSSSDLSIDTFEQQDDHHRVGGRLIKVTRAATSMPILSSPKSPEREIHRSFAASAAKSPGLSAPFSRSNTAPARTVSAGYGDAKSHFGQPKAAPIVSKSAPTKKSAHCHTTEANRAPTRSKIATGSNRLSNNKNNQESASKSNFGRKLSGILNRKKSSSSGAE